MTAAELREILVSSEFKSGLEELSSYLASIMQERPIVYLLAKCLWKQKYKFELEDKRRDLFIMEKHIEKWKHIEFKFNYDKMGEVLRDELATWGNLREIRAAVKAGQTSKSWGVMARIYEDVCGKDKKPDKKPDMFVWIICSRDLSKVADDDVKRIAAWREQRKYNKDNPYNSTGTFLTVADEFLERLQAERKFSEAVPKGVSP